MADMKKLPVTYPMITSWQWHATLFSILSDDENAKKFATEFIKRVNNIKGGF